jgi:hypothetical protein
MGPDPDAPDTAPVSSQGWSVAGLTARHSTRAVVRLRPARHALPKEINQALEVGDVDW